MKTLFALLAFVASPVAAQVSAIEPAPDIGSIYNAASVPGSPQSIDLVRFGYVEREYFVRGQARAGAADGPAEPALPYVTRIVLRMPANPSRWSGVIHVEPMHPQHGGTSHWWTTAPWIISRGDAYLAISAGDDEPTRRRSADGGPPVRQSEVARWFNPQRYAALRWPDDDGIRYALFADVVARLREAPEGVLPRPPRTVLAAGWSFTGSFLRTYINAGFHDARRRAGGRPLIDGYMVGISSRWNSSGLLPMHSGEPSWPVTDERRALRPIDAPVIEFLTEFEVALGDGAQAPEVDRGVGAHRLYELGGVIHGDALLPGGRPARPLRPTLVQLRGRGYPEERLGTQSRTDTCVFPSSDLPHGALVRAATANLLRWAERGVAPPRAAPLTMSGSEVAHDARGNPIGGIRLPELDLPLASYGVYRGTDRPDCVAGTGPGERPLFVAQPISAAEARTLYGTQARYMTRYRQSVRRLVRQGWLLEADAPTLIASAEARARELLP